MALIKSQHFAFAVINHLLKLLILSVHEGFPLLKEFRFRVLDVLQSPLSLDGAIFHGNNLIITTHTKEDRKKYDLYLAETCNQSLLALGQVRHK